MSIFFFFFWSFSYFLYTVTFFEFVSVDIQGIQRGTLEELKEMQAAPK